MTRSLPYRPVALVLAGLAAAAALTLPGRPPTAAADEKGAKDAKAPDPAAVERTRATVRMLDNLHKGYVVTITDTYVKAKEQTPAAAVLKKVFAHMEKNGDGTGRLIDATGSPLRDTNVAKTDFEKKAVAAIKGGKPYIDEVATGKDGKPVLRAATVVPAVMDACLNCHPNVKKNDVMGALVYELPIR
jgi:hypothetical protein